MILVIVTVLILFAVRYHFYYKKLPKYCENCSYYILKECDHISAFESNFESLRGRRVTSAREKNQFNNCTTYYSRSGVCDGSDEW
jgi:hypothetical protein